MGITDGEYVCNLCGESITSCSICKGEPGQRVVRDPYRNPNRSGWWRDHDHYDRKGYCDNPGRGY